MMFRCYDCGREFETPDTFQEYRGEFWGMPAYETVSCCPFCRSDEYDEIKNNSAEVEEGEEDDG